MLFRSRGHNSCDISSGLFRCVAGYMLPSADSASGNREKVAELRDVLTKRQIIYVYHNQIDARGDKANTEDEVFHACEEAVQEIMDLIHRISVSGNTYHFIVTGITQEELAVRLGLASKQHVSRMENGERSCSIDLLIELSCIPRVSTDYLLMGSELSKEKVKNDLLSIISELSTIAKKIRRYGVRKG